MAISVDKQERGGIVLMTCRGRIVEGGEASALQRHIESVLDEASFLVLDLAGIEFVDSSGLGLLVRMLNRARLAGGDLRICAVPPRLNEILRVTRLEQVLVPYESAGAAIAATYDHARSMKTVDRLATDVLCVAESRDVLMYVSELLRQAGFGVMSSDNLPDALMLLRAARPKAVVVSAGLRSVRGTDSADAFNALIGTRDVIELPIDFSHHEAGEAGIRLLDRVRACVP